MKVFLSWSGDASRRVAEALREWLPNVVQAIEPWMSAEDIEKGARWSSDIAAELAKTKAGVVCVTASNQDAPWLNFEAGALSKTVDKAMVCPYLVGLRPTDLKGPLVQFQAAEATQGDTRKLLATLNRALGEDALSDKQLGKAFDIWWPELHQALTTIGSTAPSQTPTRPERELLEEILGIVREQVKQPPNVVLLNTGFSGRQAFKYLASGSRGDALCDMLPERFAPNTKVLLFNDLWHHDVVSEGPEVPKQKDLSSAPERADNSDPEKTKGNKSDGGA